MLPVDDRSAVASRSTSYEIRKLLQTAKKQQQISKQARSQFLVVPFLNFFNLAVVSIEANITTPKCPLIVTLKQKPDFSFNNFLFDSQHGDGKKNNAARINRMLFHADVGFAFCVVRFLPCKKKCIHKSQTFGIYYSKLESFLS